MEVHNDFSWRYAKALLRASSEQGAHAAVQLCWFGFQVEVRKHSFLGRNPSCYHFKTKHSLVSRLWKPFCTEFWWLLKRPSQSFEHFLVCLPWIKQQYILLSDSQSDSAEGNAQTKWPFKAFSFCAATAWGRCPSGHTQCLSAQKLMANTLYSDIGER